MPYCGRPRKPRQLITAIPAMQTPTMRFGHGADRSVYQDIENSGLASEVQINGEAPVTILPEVRGLIFFPSVLP